METQTKETKKQNNQAITKAIDGLCPAHQPPSFAG